MYHQSLLRQSIAVLLLALLLIGCSKQSVPPVPEGTPVSNGTTPSKIALPSGILIVHNGSVIDGTGASPIPDALVAIKNGTIVAVGPENQFQIPEDARVLDAKRGSILPGFIDAHTHFLQNNSIPSLAQQLQSGVTTVRDLGSQYGIDSTSNHDISALKRRLAEAGDTIPTLILAGPIITTPGGYPALPGKDSIALEVADSEEAGEAATRLLANGADGLKIAVESGAMMYPLPVLEPEQVAAITQVAHAHHTWVSAHVTTPQEAAIAVANGANDLAHAPMGKMSNELIQQMVTRGTVLVTTLVVEGGLRANFTRSHSDAEWALVLEARRDSLQRFLAAGGKVAMGSDSGGGWMPSDMPAQEFQFMVDAGMTPMQVIFAATKNAAQACGIEDRVGTLQVGKQADVVIVGGAPLQDIRAMSDVRIVIKRGEVVIER